MAGFRRSAPGGSGSVGRRRITPARQGRRSAIPLRPARPHPPRTRRAPDGERLIAIGDIHGDRRLLDDLLNAIADNPPPAGLTDRLIFLGDYVDRGPDSAGVLDRVCGLLESRPGTVALKGNHEDLMQRFLSAGETRAFALWMVNGGDATLVSYDVEPPDALDDPIEAARCHRDLAGALPTSHRRLLDTAPAISRHGDYAFVHAGVRPGVPLEEQRVEEMLWIRDAFLASDAEFGARIVHGHTPAPAPEPHDNRVGLDTGAGKGGYLTAGLFWDTEIAFLHAYP